MDINKYLAKPDVTLGEHVRRLLDEAERLREYGYIRDTRIYWNCCSLRVSIMMTVR